MHSFLPSMKLISVQSTKLLNTRFINSVQFIHSVVCLTTSSQPLSKRVHRQRVSASQFKFKYPLLQLRSYGSCLRLLPRLPSLPMLSFFFNNVFQKAVPKQDVTNIFNVVFDRVQRLPSFHPDICRRRASNRPWPISPVIQHSTFDILKGVMRAGQKN